MADIAWLVRRLKAMSLSEIEWRISQKILQKSEEKKYKSRKIIVTEDVINSMLSNLNLDASKMHLNLENKKYRLNRTIILMNGYEYDHYCKMWNAGFQTQNSWPDTFSNSLEYKQKDKIGDARTNWELNRHFQFALLAKGYYASGNKKFLDELTVLFEDWNTSNPFLYGISWTSVMEVAIRVSNWCYVYCFLSASKNVSDKLLNKFRVGIINMTDYIAAHYSRFSSANNHLIVEAYAIGQSGILFNYKPWIDLAITILTREFPLQNYSDGVNKELSLHYQSFYMEAVGLMMRLMNKNKIKVPEVWIEWIGKMCKYLANCQGEHGETIEFGDNDEGKLLDLNGEYVNYYQYVLALMTCLLDRKYVALDNCSENLRWLFTDEEIEEANEKEQYMAEGCICYQEGGNTILRSNDGRVLIGIDHAALGFGSIAAHGHADALSFQMYVDGIPIFMDPGTYIYHCDLESRNIFRKTENHNTVCLDGKDQSEMLGAFLWGKKAECNLKEYSDKADWVMLKASHNGYKPVVHIRTFAFDKNRKLIIQDNVPSKHYKELNFVLQNNSKINISESNVEIILENTRCIMSVECSKKFSIRILDCDISPSYAVKEQAKKITISTMASDIKTIIKIEAV